MLIVLVAVIICLGVTIVLQHKRDRKIVIDSFFDNEGIPINEITEVIEDEWANHLN